MKTSASIFKASDLQTAELRASDGIVGRVDDLLLDADVWHVRYVVVDTGSWLAGRRVLISSRAVIGRDEHCLAASLTRAQVQASPGAGAASLTRADEEKLHEHYRWSPYWTAQAGGFSLTGDTMPDPPTLAPPHADAPLAASDPSRPTQTATERELRSARHLRGRSIEGADGDIGTLDDLLIDSSSWEVRYLVVDTKRWLPGGEVLVAPQWLTAADWAGDGSVTTDLTRAAVKASPKYERGTPLSRDYLDELHRHYQREPWRE